MAASPKHIAKYTDGYRRLYPRTEILLIEATMAGMLFSGVDLTFALYFLNTYTKGHGIEATARQPIVLHMFSNGGGKNAMDLTARLHELHGTLPFDAVIFDSCPGLGDIKGGTQAMSFALPKAKVIRFVGWYMLYLTTLLYVLIITVLGLEDVVTRIRRSLNDVNIVSKNVPRLYLYSKGDTLVHHKDVHAHVEDAMGAGYVDVREEVFTTAPHCVLLNEDADRYWNAVMAVCSAGKVGQ